MSAKSTEPAKPAPAGAAFISNGIPAGRSIKPVDVLNAKPGTAKSPFTYTSTTSSNVSAAL